MIKFFNKIFSNNKIANEQINKVIFSAVKPKRKSKLKFKRVINFAEYFAENMDDIGRSWEKLDPRHNLYLPIPEFDLDLGGYIIKEHDINRTSFSKELVLNSSSEDELRIIAPMNLGGGHWVGFVVKLDKNNATINFIDSNNPELNLKEHSSIVKKEYERIVGIFKEKKINVTTQSGVLKGIQCQDDAVSCGAYFWENAMNSFEVSDQIKGIKSTVEIRQHQLKMMSDPKLIKSISESLFIQDKLFEFAVAEKGTKKIIDKKQLAELKKDSDFSLALDQEYGKSSEDIILKELNHILAKQNFILDMCKFSVKFPEKDVLEHVRKNLASNRRIKKGFVPNDNDDPFMIAQRVLVKIAENKEKNKYQLDTNLVQDKNRSKRGHEIEQKSQAKKDKQKSINNLPNNENQSIFTKLMITLSKIVPAFIQNIYSKLKGFSEKSKIPKTPDGLSSREVNRKLTGDKSNSKIYSSVKNIRPRSYKKSTKSSCKNGFER